MIDLCLRELFFFREMQTDPNWSNFLWNAKTRQVKEFYLFPFPSQDADESPRSNWLHLLLAAAQQDREACLRWGLELGYLIGEENDVGRSIRDSFPSAIFGE